MDFYSIIQSELKVYVNTIIMRALFEGDKYGYEICKEIETRTNGQYKIKQPTLYSTLKRLEAQGLIKSYEDESVTHGGKRRYYSLTDLGIETFTKSQNDWEYSRTVMDRLISDKEVDLSILPPVELPKRMSRPKTKRQSDALDINETGPQKEVVYIVKDEEPIFPVLQQPEPVNVFANDADNNAKTEENYNLLYPRPIKADDLSYFNYSGASYTNDLKNQQFVEDAATSLDINDAEFSSLYQMNPYDSAATAPPDEDESETAAAKDIESSRLYEKEAETEPVVETIKEKESDAVFLPPPEPEIQEPSYTRNPSSPLFNRNNAGTQSDDEAAQNYIDVEYKNILTRFIRFNIVQGESAGAGSAVIAHKPTFAPATVHSESGLDDIKVRQHNKSANIQYSKKFYVFISRLNLHKSIVLSALMLLEVLVYYLVFDVILGYVGREEKAYYYPAIIISALPVIYSLIAYAINPDRKKRIVNSYFEDLLIYIFAAGVAIVAVYLTCGWAFGMNRNNMSEFYVRLGLYVLLSLNFIVSSVIFTIIHRTKKYAA